MSGDSFFGAFLRSNAVNGAQPMGGVQSASAGNDSFGGVSFGNVSDGGDTVQLSFNPGARAKDTPESVDVRSLIAKNNIANLSMDQAAARLQGNGTFQALQGAPASFPALK